MKAQELLDLFNKQDNYEDVYKAFLAYILDLEVIDPDIDKKLNKVLDEYHNSYDIISFVDERIYDTARELIED